MKSLELEALQAIANRHDIDYQVPETPFNRRAVISSMSRVFAIPREELYTLMADVGAHGRFFPHLRALNVIDREHLANSIGANQVVVVEGLAEGGSKLGVKLFTFKPPDRIEGELMTDPFVSAEGVTSHEKKGSIVWRFEAVDETHTRMSVESDFGVGANSAYIRGTVDHVWLDFFENVMVYTNELAPAEKMAAPFPELR
jgi:ribosome-associated toxin RatA of RatAB toxin-antitoxin module